MEVLLACTCEGGEEHAGQLRRRACARACAPDLVDSDHVGRADAGEPEAEHKLVASIWAGLVRDDVALK